MIRTGEYCEHVESWRGYGRMLVKSSRFVREATEDGTETVQIFFCRWNAGSVRHPDWREDPFYAASLRPVAAANEASVPA